MANIIVIGASGTIGRAVADLLAREHSVLRVARSHGDVTVDMSEKASLEGLFHKTGTVDAVVCAAGDSRFGKPLDQVSDDDFVFSIHNKLMGQVNLVRIALGHLTDNGSITLTSGVFGTAPWPATSPTAMVNAALEGFVRAAALDVARGIRINVVSPIFVTETARKMGMPGENTLSAADTALAYKAALEGSMTGRTLDVREYTHTPH
jgi:NAD(P)-dependent dehydrogenase (short-subunit alcohol dehydrogenase family)